MDFKEACSFIYGFVDWEKRGGRPTRSQDIEDFRTFLSSLGDPHLAYPTIHVVGTNGKGSVSAMIAAVLMEHGLKVGLYTSPHLVTVRERIAVDGSCISEESFALTVDHLMKRDPEATISSPGYRTTFTLLTATAFLFFADSKIDVGVVEAGLGGRLDATVVVDPAVTVITPIHRDHMLTLGKTLRVIARDKAAVIRSGNILVTSPQNSVVRAEIRDVVDRIRPRRWVRVGSDVRYRSLRPIDGTYGLSLRIDHHRIRIPSLPLRGKYQVVNASTALAAAASFCPSLPVKTLKRGLAKTSWPGRLDVRPGNPDILLDGAHNVQAVGSLVEFVRDHLMNRYRRISCLFALSNGKDTRLILRNLQDLKLPVVLCNADSHRGQPVSVLEEAARQFGIHTHRADSPGEGLQTARRLAGKKGLVIVCGSLYLIGAIIDLLGRAPE